MLPKLLTVSHRVCEISVEHCQRTCGLTGLSNRSDLLLSPRKRLLGDANTSPSNIFLSKVNYCVSGRCEINLRQALKRLCVKMPDFA